MTEVQKSDEIPAALEAAQNSWRCVQSKDKEGWLALMADNICMEDPIGVALTNPTGEGIRGKEEISAFYDKNMAESTIAIEVHESRVAANTSAHVMTLTTTLPGGVKSRVRGIFTYYVNEEGKITNLRGYWQMSDMTFEQPD